MSGEVPEQTDLATWLLEQVDEDEQTGTRFADCAYLLSYVEAHRQIIAEHAQDEGTGYCRRCEWDSDERDDPAKGGGTRWVRYPCPTLRLLALPYADRPGYRADLWAPDGR